MPKGQGKRGSHKESKTAKSATRSGAKSSKKGWAIGITAIVAATLIIGGLYWWSTLQSPVTPPEDTTPTTADFSIVLKDGVTGASRNSSLWELFNASDYLDNSTYVSTETGVDKSELTVAVLNREMSYRGTNTYLVMRITARNNVTYAHDWRAYSDVWKVLDVYGENVFEFYATPSPIVGTLIAANGTIMKWKNFTSTVTYNDEDAGFGGAAYAAGNFTVLAGFNSSDIGWCGYNDAFVPTAGYEGTKNVYLVFSFNNTINLNYMDLVSYSSLGPAATWVESSEASNTTAIAYKTTEFLGTSYLAFNWLNTIPATVRVNDVFLIYGSASEVRLGRGTSLLLLV